MTKSSHHFAEVAQLVERNLAKVEATGSSPVFRSSHDLHRSSFGDVAQLGEHGFHIPKVGSSILPITTSFAECPQGLHPFK